ncbi:MAG: hypothetical protein KC503_37880 [Myxococcales bacterium]|nr:hypothetical protein [Myxococcales bacterium]
MKRLSHTAALTTLALTLSTGCAGTRVYSPASAAGFDLSPGREIDDAAIERAFKARPQLRVPARVAFYSFDPSRTDQIAEQLEQLPQVKSTYAIPPFIMTGQRRFDERAPRQRPPSLKKMRLLAARARCDLLLIFDYGHRIKRTLNWLSAFTVFIVPTLFLPYLDEEVESYLTAYVIDVRNGYLYGQVTSDKKRGKAYSSIYSDWGTETTKAFWSKLLGDTRGALDKLLARRDLREGAAGKTAP